MKRASARITSILVESASLESETKMTHSSQHASDREPADLFTWHVLRNV